MSVDDDREERLAIMVHDGGMAEAEARAALELLRRKGVAAHDREARRRAAAALQVELWEALG